MTLDTFITKYNGKKVEFHSYSSGALYQCVDLANQYITEVLGLPAIIGTNAQDFPTKRGNEFNWIINTPDALPTKGALMIFKSTDGVGHISIFVEGNLNLFRSFDQNYPTGSPCKIVQHNYRNVLGWLTPIMPENTYTEEQMTAVRLERDANWQKYQEEKADHDATKAQLDEEKQSNSQFIQTLASKLTTIPDEGAIVGAVERLLAVEDQLLKCRKDYTQLEKEKFMLEADKNREIAKLKAEVDAVGEQLEQQQAENTRLATQVKQLSERIDDLLDQPKPQKPISGNPTGLQKLLNSIISVVRRLLWLEK